MLPVGSLPTGTASRSAASYGSFSTRDLGGFSLGLSWLPSLLNYLVVSVSQDGKVAVQGVRGMHSIANDALNWKSVQEGDGATDWYCAVRIEFQTGKIYAVGHTGKVIQIGGSRSRK